MVKMGVEGNKDFARSLFKTFFVCEMHRGFVGQVLAVVSIVLLILIYSDVVAKVGGGGGDL